MLFNRGEKIVPKNEKCHEDGCHLCSNFKFSHLNIA